MSTRAIAMYTQAFATKHYSRKGTTAIAHHQICKRSSYRLISLYKATAPAVLHIVCAQSMSEVLPLNCTHTVKMTLLLASMLLYLSGK